MIVEKERNIIKEKRQNCMKVQDLKLQTLQKENRTIRIQQPESPLDFFSPLP